MPDYLSTGSSRYLPDSLLTTDELNVALARENERPAPEASMGVQAAPASGGMGALTLLSQLGALGNNGGGTQRKKPQSKGNGHGKTHSIGLKGLPNSLNNSVAENRRIARVIMAKKYPKWDNKDFRALVKLYNRESGWNAKADNPTSSAAGIAQRMMSAHPGKLGGPIEQLLWGEKYISGRYGDPEAAWRHSQQTGWY